MTWPAFRRHLHHVLGRLGLFGRLVSAASDPAQQERIGPAISAFKRFSRLLDELATLAPLLKQQRFGVREIADILKTSLSQVHYHFPGKSEQGIQITTLEESRSPSCDHLFVVGLLEGEFPLSPAPDIFLDDSDRRTLGLQSADAGLAAERLLFYQILAQARREIQLLYPRGEGTTTLSPSPFVDEVQVLLSSGEKPQPHADILTLADLHRFLGRSLSRKPSIPEATQALQLVRLCGNVPLLSAPVHHLRGMAIADQRAQAQQLGPYEGLLDHPAALDSLERRFGRGHAFSITQLESYARCPFFFFADRILGAVPLRDPGEDLAALERGNLIHRILYAFYRERRRNGQVERVRPENLPQALQRLRQIARSAAEDLGLKDFFWEMELERILGPEDKNKGAGLLPRFLELEARELDATAPSLFELSFGAYPGMGERDPLSTQEPYTLEDARTGEQVHILGKIDRIDRTPEGQFVVLDYKTGQAPGGLADMRDGLSLQLPVYLLAVEQLLHSAGLEEGVAGAYYELRDHERCGKTGLFANKAHKGQVYQTRSQAVEREEFRRALEQARSFALHYVRSMRQGRFHVTLHPPEKTCTHCAYRRGLPPRPPAHARPKARGQALVRRGFDLTPAQLKALDNQRNIAVTASAGSGKTATLVERYIALLLTNPQTRVPQILAITFTQKAASEMRQRIAENLQRALTSEKDGKTRRRLEAVYEGLSGARISTIHAFCAALLRQYPVEAQVDPHFAVLEEVEATRLRDAAVGETLEVIARRDPSDPTRLALRRLLQDWDRRYLEGALRALILKKRLALRWTRHYQSLRPEEIFASWETRAQELLAPLWKTLREEGKFLSLLHELASLTPLRNGAKDTAEQLLAPVREDIKTLLENPGLPNARKILPRLADALTTSKGEPFKGNKGSKANWTPADLARFRQALSATGALLAPHYLAFSRAPGARNLRAAELLQALSRVFIEVCSRYERKKGQGSTPRLRRSPGALSAPHGG